MLPTGEDFLSEVPLFKLLDEKEKSDLAQVLEHHSYAAGARLFNMGEPGDSMYIVRKGSVELYVKDTTGTKIVLADCGVGEIFGELSLFDGGPRTATAVTREESELLVLDRGDLLQFVRRNPDASLDLLATMGQRIRSTDEVLRKTAARNINAEMETLETIFDKIADVIAEFSGSMTFLAINGAIFAGWMIWNIVPITRHFDPYPFGFLTMIMSVEAIFLSIFVLISQNRQAAKDRLRSDTEYEVNLKAELEIAHLHEKVDLLTEEVLARLPRPERKTMTGK